MFRILPFETIELISQWAHDNILFLNKIFSMKHGHRRTASESIGGSTNPKKHMVKVEKE